MVVSYLPYKYQLHDGGKSNIQQTELPEEQILNLAAHFIKSTPQMWNSIFSFVVTAHRQDVYRPQPP